MTEASALASMTVCCWQIPLKVSTSTCDSVANYQDCVLSFQQVILIVRVLTAGCWVASSSEIHPHPKVELGKIRAAFHGDEMSHSPVKLNNVRK